MEYVFLAIGLAVGFIIGFLVVKVQKKSADTQNMLLAQQLEDEKKRCSLDLAKQKEHHDELMQEQDQRHDQMITDMKTTFNQTIEHLESQLKAVTEDLLKARQQEFADASKTTMDGYVDQLSVLMKDMKQAMDDNKEKQDQYQGKMETNIQTLIKNAERTYNSANELTNALKHDTKVQGDFGEQILDRILESQGFIEGTHYDLQYVEKDEAGHELKDEDGKGLRPDVILHLDKKRDVIIDSKMNCTDYIDYVNALKDGADPEVCNNLLKKHVNAIKNQVELLSKKDYTKYHKATASRMDFVIMFIPISAAWWEALNYDKNLWRDAMAKRVFIAEEQSLFAALQIVNLTWTQIKQENNHQKIFELANEMINRLGQFMKHYNEVGSMLDKAKAAFDHGRDKITEGGQSVITTANKLVRLGARMDASNPIAPLLDIDDVQQLPAPEPHPQLPDATQKTTEESHD